MIGTAREWWERTLGFFRGRRADGDLEDEFADHIAAAAEEHMRGGMSPEEARRRAAAEFGSHLAAREQVGDQRGLPWLESFFQDVAYALRGMRKNAGFTSVVVLTLALGIGANTALFSLVEAVMLRGLPVRDPQNLYFLTNVGAKGANGGPPYEVYESFRGRAHSFESMAAVAADNFTLGSGGRLDQVWGEYASGSYFATLGIGARIGRVLTPDDERLQPPVAVLSHACWQSRFGGAADAIGATVSVNGKPFTIAGVAEPRFTGMTPGRTSCLTVPFTAQDTAALRGPSWFFEIVARLKPGVSPARARAEIDPLFQNFMSTLTDFAPDLRRDYFARMELLPAAEGTSGLRDQFSKPLLILMALVGVVLLVGCANLANLFMARAASRQREFAVRLAIGAGWWRLARQLLTETALQFAAGAALGLLLADRAAHAMAAFLAVGRNPMFIDPRLDGTVLAFTAGITLLAALIFGVAPTLASARANPQAALHGSGGRATDSRLRAGMRQALVVAQVALSLALLVGGGLFVRTLANLNSIALGFRPQGVATMRVSPSGPGYTDERLQSFWSDALARAGRLPGVASASVSVLTPLSGRNRGIRVSVAGLVHADFMSQLMTQNYVSEDYFQTFGIPLVAGRGFNAADTRDAAQVAIVNEAAVRYYFAERNPLGAAIETGVGAQHRIYRIVGVVGDARHNNMRQEIPRFIYIPVAQRREKLGQLTLAVRTASNAARLAPEVQREVHGLAPDVLITESMTMQQQVDAALVQERLLSAVGGFFSLLALVLSAVGLYGLLAHVVGQRTGEIGIRMALGADRGAVVWMVLKRSLWLVAIGLAAGLPVSLWAARPLASLLYGLKPTDGVTIAVGVALLTATALLASYLPARRAARIDPIAALRSE